MLTLLRRNRGFSIFFVTQCVSNLGDAVRNVAVPLFLLQLTHAPTLVAELALLEIVPSLVLQLPFGALVDRWDRHRTLLMADLGRGGLTLLIPATALAHGPVLVVLFATAVPLSALSALFGAAFSAITPSLVGRDRMEQAYGLIEAGESLAWVAGPVVAGLLVTTIGGPNALLLDGASFLLSALGLAIIRIHRTERTSERRSLWRELLEGLRFLVSNPTLRRVQISWTVYGSIGYGVVIGLVFVGSRGGSVGPDLASLAVAAYAAGSLVGTLIAGRRRPRSPSLTVARYLTILALGALLVAIGPDVVVPVGGLLFGLGEGYFLVTFLALRAETTPDKLMGRVNSAGRLLAEAAGAVAVVWMGLALQWLRGPGAFGLLTLFALLLAGWMAVGRPLSASAR